MNPVRQPMGSAASAMFEAGGVKQTAQIVELPNPPWKVSKCNSNVD